MASATFPTRLADLRFNDSSNNKSIYANIKALRKSTLSIPNRLASILSDAGFVRAVSQHFNLPLVANERCGSWYIASEDKAGSTYFKSTDGHHGRWDFSLRRLNLQLLSLLGQHGGAVVVDSTRRGKNLPDAFGKTVPIWVAVMNRALFPELTQFHALQRPPYPDQLSGSEVSQIEDRLDEFVQSFKALNVDVAELRRDAKQPIQIRWAVNGVFDPEWTVIDTADFGENGTGPDYSMLVLCSASRRVHGAETSEGGYVQGAGDDSEGWAHGLTPQLFWRHKDELLQSLEDDLLDLIQRLLQDEKGSSLHGQDILVKPTRNIFISAGCRNTDEGFDLVVNCEGSSHPTSARILDLECRFAKLGSKDLREKLSMVKSFVMTTVERKPEFRLLITCSTGRDLSVGVVLVLLCLFYNSSGQLRSGFMPDPLVVDKQLVKQRLAWISTSKPDANPSRATLQAVNSFLMERPD